VTDPVSARCLEAFDETAEAHRRSASVLVPGIARTIARICETLAAGGKVLTCGDGGSAAESQHFAAELSGRFRKERAAWPAMALTVDTSALTAIGNDRGAGDRHRARAGSAPDCAARAV
jgi:D-sedoheptulose 7-phosphate isomerase